MTQHWQDIVPVDRYYVHANGLLHDYDRKILTFLYQPLMGAKSLSLYMTMWAELEENKLWSKGSTHHRLMILMDLNLKEIYQTRLRLEGMNLITTLVRKEEGVRTFVYVLKPPLTPERFFLTDLLNIPLQRKIGNEQYSRIKQFFSSKKASETNGFQNVTKGYEEVFQLIPPNAYKSNLSVEESKEVIGRNQNEGIEIKHFSFDFEILMAGLSKNIVPKSALTEEVKEVISKLAFLYGIDAIKMKDFVLDATDYGITDTNLLRKYVSEWYDLQNGGLPTLVDRTQPLLYKSEINEPKTKQEKLIHYFETNSPRRLLQDISGGAEATKVDLDIIEGIMFQQKLQPGVINVLIHYVMLKTDMKLNKGYVQKIAGHWVRKEVNTVKEAMELAKSESKQYQQWATSDNYKKNRKTKQPIRKELLPDWFYEDENKEDLKTEKVSPDFEEKKRALEQRIRNLDK